MENVPTITANPKHPDAKLFETESAEDQVARMGTHWKFSEQYEKQLELPVHRVNGANPEIREITRDGRLQNLAVYLTVCGLVLGSDDDHPGGTIRTTDDPEDVTCEKCAA